MPDNIFIPQNRPAAPVADAPSVPPETSSLVRSSTPLQLAHIALFVLAFGLPLVFLPGLWGSLGFAKTTFAFVLVSLLLVCGLLHVLTQPRSVIHIPKAVFLMWALGLVGVLGALLSPDLLLSLRGSYIGVQTAGFLVLFVLVMTVPLLLNGQPNTVRRVTMLLGGSLALISLYVLARVLFGASFLTLGSFDRVTTTPIGSFNDTALLSGALLVALVAALSLSQVSRLKQMVIVGMGAAALLVLVAVNFVLAWWLVGLFVAGFAARQLLELRQDRSAAQHSQRTVSIVFSMVIVMVCGWYALVGGSNGTFLQQWANISFVEVRPSATATLDVLRSVYREQVFLGAGPNQFATAWRTFKDPAINETVFWNVDFASGFSFVITAFVQLGVLGGILLVLFQLWFLFSGYRALSAPQQPDQRWSALTTSTFTAAVFLWVMLNFYTPGTTALLATALLTGLAFVGIIALRPSSAITIPVTRIGNTPNVGKILGVLMVFAVCGAVSYTVIEQYRAEAMINKAAAEGTLTRERTSEAYALYPDPRFLSLQAQLSAAELQQIIQITDPSEEDQNRFVGLAQAAVADAQSATAVERTGVSARMVMAGVYNLLANTGLEGARDLALETLTAARVRDPRNPEIPLATAQVYVQAEDAEAARTALEDAVALKANYTPALLLLTELDIASGDLTTAIERTRAVVTLEPRNPTRYFQLGMLYAANQQLDQAVGAYRAALTLDPQYANARYMLAQVYTVQGDTAAALAELEKVRESNPDNQQLLQQIDLLTHGSSSATTVAPAVELTEPGARVTSDNAVVTDETPDTSLVTPLNRAAE